MAATGDLRRAIRHGNAAGALAAMKLGAQASLPTAADVASFLATQPNPAP
jgi:sugar/nucleoside kinase (ribokinase family)